MFHTKRYRYRFGDIDHAGIAYYPALLHYFHCAFEDWWQDALEIRYPELMRDRKIGFPAVHLDASFVRPVQYGDEPYAHVGVHAVGTSSVRFGYWMSIDEAGKQPHCMATVTTVAVHMDTMAKLEVPDDLREAFARYQLEDGEFPASSPRRDASGA